MRVASEVGNLRSEFGYARPSGSRVIRFVCDGRWDRQTDGRTDKSKPYFPLSTGGGIITAQLKASHDTGTTNGLRNLVVPMSEELVIVCVGMRGDARQVK